MPTRRGQLRGKIVRMVTDRETGRSKGFGFIRDAEGTEYFFHISGVQDTSIPFAEMAPDMDVEFTPIEGPKGLRAIEVMALE